MTVSELYKNLTAFFPEELREEWDNDGIMCCPDASAEIKNVLITLDVTEEIVDYAIERNFDLIISHHPLVFRPVSRITEDLSVSRKLIKLISNNVSVFSFHTRADKAKGGVNDILAALLGLTAAEPFGEGGMGRIGYIAEECDLDEFVFRVKTVLGAEGVRFSDGYNTVHKVALLGGDGKDFVADAIKAGADTYVTGRMSYNVMEEASELGINLIEAGHYYTEQPITGRFAQLVSRFDGNAYVEIADSNMIKNV